MSRINSDIILLLIMINTFFHPTNQSDPVIKTLVKPEGGKVELGSYWMMQCAVKEGSNVIWYKWVGDIRTRIGYNDIVSGRQGDVISAGRFKLVGEAGSKNYVSSLYLSSAQTEDSGRFECVTDQSNASNVFVVCQDLESEPCACMLRSMWANPMCLPQQYTDMSDYYKRLLAGLGITLAVVTLYVIVALLLYGRDCIMLFHRDRLEEAEKRRRMKMSRVEFSRSKHKKDTVEVFDRKSESDEAHLTPSETVSQASGETAAASEDSGFSGSTQKDKKKLSYRGKRNNNNNNNTYSSNESPYNNNTSNKTENNTNQAKTNPAYNDEEGKADNTIYEYKEWNAPNDRSAIKSVSANVNTKPIPNEEFAGTMI